MDYFLTEEQQMIQDLARQVAEEKVLPVRAHLDEAEEYPTEVLNTSPRPTCAASISPKNTAAWALAVSNTCSPSNRWPGSAAAWPRLTRLQHAGRVPHPAVRLRGAEKEISVQNRLG